FLLPSLTIAAPYLRRDTGAAQTPPPTADAFDRRIVALLTLGPMVMTVLLSLETGRDAVALWGYPLWLFFGLWVAMNERVLERITLWRVVFLWACWFAGAV